MKCHLLHLFTLERSFQAHIVSTFLLLREERVESILTHSGGAQSRADAPALQKQLVEVISNHQVCVTDTS